MKEGDVVKASPAVTGHDDWITGVVIDVEQNPFLGIVISIRDALGDIFWGEEKYFQPA